MTVAAISEKWKLFLDREFACMIRRITDQTIAVTPDVRDEAEAVYAKAFNALPNGLFVKEPT